MMRAALMLMELGLVVFFFFLVLTMSLYVFDSFQNAMDSLYDKVNSFEESVKDFPNVPNFDKETFLPNQD